MQFGVYESVYFWGKYKPNSIAIISDGEKYSYLQLNHDIINLAKKIKKSGYDGTRIGIMVSRKYDFFVTLFTILRLRKSAVLLNIGLTKESLVTNVTDTNLKLIIFDKQSAELSKEISEEVQISLIDYNSSENVQAVALDQFEGANEKEEFAVLFSSGTTGTPKGIERDHYSMVTEHLGWCLELGINKKTVFYIGRPAFYTGGLVISLSVFLVGGTVILNNFQNENDFESVWEDYQKTLKSIAVQWAFLIPDQIKFFIDAADEKSLKADSILVMGAPISGNEKIKAKQKLKSDIIESWGNTESLGTITEVEDLYSRPQSIGRPFLTDELYIVNDSGEIVGPNEPGRIAGSKIAGFTKYSNRDHETQKIIVGDLIISEDMGHVDQDNYFYIDGRIQDHIVRNGESVFMTHIEKKIYENMKPIKLCLCPIGDEVPKIYCIVERNFYHSGLKEEINKLLSDNEKIEEVFDVNKLPIVPSGKINKVVVKKIIIDKLS